MFKFHIIKLNSQLLIGFGLKLAKSAEYTVLLPLNTQSEFYGNKFFNTFWNIYTNVISGTNAYRLVPIS